MAVYEISAAIGNLKETVFLLLIVCEQLLPPLTGGLTRTSPEVDSMQKRKSSSIPHSVFTLHTFTKHNVEARDSPRLSNWPPHLLVSVFLCYWHGGQVCILKKPVRAANQQFSCFSAVYSSILLVYFNKYTETCTILVLKYTWIYCQV